MASLPAQHPHLALHLTDRALTPIISTSLLPPPSASQPPRSSTPSSSSSSSSYPDSSNNKHNHNHSHHHHHQAGPSSLLDDTLSLAALTSTALTSHQTAKRLTHGAPLRTMIEYPARGPVVLHSYLCPMSLALGTPGRRARRRPSQDSLTTAAGAGIDEDEDEGSGGGGGGKGDHDDVATDDPDDPDVPMLVATVVAPAAQDLKEARRAAGRLEHVAKAVQTVWIAEGAAGLTT